jgi:hypothetical protein
MNRLRFQSRNRGKRIALRKVNYPDLSFLPRALLGRVKRAPEVSKHRSTIKRPS